MGVILLKSIILGALVGGAAAAGASRMYYAPKVQSMASFRTLGELNACKGDAISHFSFGLGFLFTSTASVVAGGALSQDLLHRIIPNWSAGILLLKNKKVEETLYNPTKMFIAGTGVGIVVVVALNMLASLVPAALAEVANGVLGSAATWMLNPVMPIIFWIAAIDAGKTTGITATITGTLAAMFIGNAVPGLVLGILIGATIEEHGVNKAVIVMMVVTAILLAFSAYFNLVLMG
ncbi:MAG: DUF4311 domain-containing protein [Anaerolineaceae bacterium]|jgi:uncharacterized protein (TIGR03580 family)|nr:DUF4311 domain-containing protein [Anaerolineaceae bacterium]